MVDRRNGPTSSFPRQGVVVMGVSGSGKSTLGKLLSSELGCPFIEGDELHDPASVAKMRAGIPLDDQDRWPWLDRLGRALGRSVAQEGLAVCACSALKLAYRQRLAACAGVPVSFVMLEAPEDELQRRLDRRDHPYMPASLLKSQLDTLERPGAGERALILDSSRPPADICRDIVDWLQETGAAPPLGRQR